MTQLSYHRRILPVGSHCGLDILSSEVRFVTGRSKLFSVFGAIGDLFAARK